MSRLFHVVVIASLAATVACPSRAPVQAPVVAVTRPRSPHDVRGHVVAPARAGWEPLDGVGVVLIAGEEEREAATGADGQFQFGDVPATYDLALAAPRGRPRAVMLLRGLHRRDPTVRVPIEWTERARNWASAWRDEQSGSLSFDLPVTPRKGPCVWAFATPLGTTYGASKSGRPEPIYTPVETSEITGTLYFLLRVFETTAPETEGYRYAAVPSVQVKKHGETDLGVVALSDVPVRPITAKIELPPDAWVDSTSAELAPEPSVGLSFHASRSPDKSLDLRAPGPPGTDVVVTAHARRRGAGMHASTIVDFASIEARISVPDAPEPVAPVADATVPSSARFEWTSRSSGGVFALHIRGASSVPTTAWTVWTTEHQVALAEPRALRASRPSGAAVWKLEHHVTIPDVDELTDPAAPLLFPLAYRGGTEPPYATFSETDHRNVVIEP